MSTDALDALSKALYEEKKLAGVSGRKMHLENRIREIIKNYNIQAKQKNEKIILFDELKSNKNIIIEKGKYFCGELEKRKAEIETFFSKKNPDELRKSCRIQMNKQYEMNKVARDYVENKIERLKKIMLQ